jgi:hypothetical protein
MPTLYRLGLQEHIVAAALRSLAAAAAAAKTTPGFDLKPLRCFG